MSNISCPMRRISCSVPEYHVSLFISAAGVILR